MSERKRHEKKNIKIACYSSTEMTIHAASMTIAQLHATS